MPDGLPQWSRVVLKLSGEAFADSTIGYGIDGKVVASAGFDGAEGATVAHAGEERGERACRRVAR